MQGFYVFCCVNVQSEGCMLMPGVKDVFRIAGLILHIWNNVGVHYQHQIYKWFNNIPPLRLVMQDFRLYYLKQ